MAATVSSELPELGDSSSGVVSLEVEQEIGKQLLRQVHAEVPTVSDPILKYFTEMQLYSLAEHSELKRKQLFPVLIDSSEINAFAAPGGVVGINLGLYLAAAGRQRVLRGARARTGAPEPAPLRPADRNATADRRCRISPRCWHRSSSRRRPAAKRASRRYRRPRRPRKRINCISRATAKPKPIASASARSSKPTWTPPRWRACSSRCNARIGSAAARPSFC